MCLTLQVTSLHLGKSVFVQCLWRLSAVRTQSIRRGRFTHSPMSACVIEPLTISLSFHRLSDVSIAQKCSLLSRLGTRPKQILFYQTEEGKDCKPFGQLKEFGTPIPRETLVSIEYHYCNYKTQAQNFKALTLEGNIIAKLNCSNLKWPLELKAMGRSICDQQRHIRHKKRL